MTVRFRKKVRKYRGTGGRGYGGKKKHRGGGSKGGKGWAGARAHKKSFLYNYDRGHLGYKGFQPPKAVVARNVIINLDDLNRLAKKEGKKAFDLGEMGFTKLLAKGTLSSPLTIKVAKASEAAKKKVEAAGGKLEAETITGGEEATEAAEAKETKTAKGAGKE